MPPRIKITRDEIISTCINIVRETGVEALNARNVASALSCSTQPIFSNFENMEELRLAVVGKAEEIFANRMQEEIKSGEYTDYKASGMAYVKFARNEKELFKLLYMRDRTDEAPVNHSVIDEKIEKIVEDTTGLKGDNAKLFHLEIWAFVHGIATMFATDFLDIDINLVSSMITDAYKGLRIRHGLEK